MSEIIETALKYYYTHCVTQAVRKRGRNDPKGQTFTAKFKDQQEAIQERREYWKIRAAEVKQAIDQYSSL